jgi:MarR family transcriptional regulator, organic hydroperoxide resistance regulator
LFFKKPLKAAESKYCKCMYFSSRALARRIEKLAIEAWKKVDLSPSHGYLLLLVIEEAGIGPSALADQLLLTPSTITRLIEKLEEKKLVVRASEGKTTQVYPTQKAKELYTRLKECLKDFYEKYSGILGKEESAKMVQGMNRITDKLT